MKNYETSQIRNISLIGNSGSGKTTLAEAMLFEGGVIDRRGDVTAKNTVSDYRDLEHENGNSIFSTVLYTEFQDKKINFVDCPGLDDFSGGIISALHATDTAVMAINAQNGVEVGTEIQFRHATRMEKPIVLVINHLDHEKANYESTIESLRERLGGAMVTVQYPLNPGPGFNSIIDVLLMKMLKFPADGGKPEVLDIPASEMDKVEEIRASLIEKAAESDESLMEVFFANDTLSEDEISQGIRAGLKSRSMFPVFCASAKKNMGVARLMDFICKSAPSPDQAPGFTTVEGKVINCSSTGAASLFIFKTSIEQHIGEMNYFRVITGEVTESIDMTNVNNSTKERLAQLFAVAGRKREKVTKLVAGDIGATVKLKNSRFDQTLAIGANAVAFEPISYLLPKYRTAIKTKVEGEEEKLAEALNKIHLEDPTIQVELSKELKQTIVHGQGEYHLNIMKWHLDNIYKIETEFIAPKIPYRETITKVAQSMYRHKKQSGGSGQFGEAHMVIEPFEEGMPDPVKYKIEGKEINVSVRDKQEIDLAWGGKLVYLNCIVGGSIEARFMPAILKGILEKMEEGPLTGSYARDIRVAVYDGKMHPVDSNEISFRLAGRNAFKAAFKTAGPKILEPIYTVEILVPADSMGDVMSDLQGRRAIIEGMGSESGFEKITARVPLAEMNKYSTALSSCTSGRATYSMKFARYEQVPSDVQEKLLKAYEAEQKEEE